MRLLELLPKMSEFGRMKRASWKQRYIVRKPESVHQPLILCDFGSMEIEEYLFTFDDLLSNEWEMVE